jgi:Transposase, Mutator family
MSTSTRSGPGRWRAATPIWFLDAKVEKLRDGGRVVNKALVIAHGVHETGGREILSIHVGEAETEAFWTEFLRGLVKRGLVRGRAGHQRRACRAEGRDCQGPGCRLADKDRTVRVATIRHRSTAYGDDPR